MPLFTGPEFSQQLDDLTVGLSRVVFPILVLLGLNGLLVGILNAYDEFTVPALIPLVWNVVIIVALVTLRPLFEGPDELYAYAIGVLAGTRRAVPHGDPAAETRRVPAPDLVQLARRARRQDPQADAPGHDRAGAHQLQPADQLDPRLARERGGAVGDRPRVPHLHAAPGHVLRRGRDRRSSRPCRASPPAATWTACGAPRPTASARSRCCSSPPPRRRSRSRSRSPASSTSAGTSTRNPPARPPRRCSGSRSASRSRARTCCSPAPTSASSSRGRRPRSPASRWRSTSPCRPRSTGRWASAASSSAPPWPARR